MSIEINLTYTYSNAFDANYNFEGEKAADPPRILRGNSEERST